MNFSLYQKLPSTVEKMMSLFPYLTVKQANQLDREIKLRIVWDNRRENILSHVKLVLKTIKKNNYTFNPHCETLAKAYIENNEKLVCNENLFNLLGLIASVLLLLIELVSMSFPCELVETIFKPYVVYLGSLIVFLVLLKKGWAYKNETLKEYLSLLSKSSPSVSFVSTACFCILMFSGVESIVSVISLLVCALLPCCLFIKAFIQLTQKPKNQSKDNT